MALNNNGEEEWQESFEEVVSRIVMLQSKLEKEANALEGLIEIACRCAENENSNLLSLLKMLKDKANIIKNTVMTMEK